MLRYFKIWLTTFTVFIVIDLLWLTVIAKPVYDHFIGDFLSDNPKLIAAGVFYILFVVGIVYFALLPALKNKSSKLATVNGALFGFFTYMTYELTNFAVIDGWPFGIVPIDIAWGTLLGLFTSYISYKLIRKLKI